MTCQVATPIFGAVQEPVGLAASVPEGTANPYAAVLSGLQSLLDGPLFKPQQGKAARVDPSPAAAVEPAEEADALEGEGEEQEQDEAAAASSGVSPSGRSTGSARRPRKRQATSQQVSVLCHLATAQAWACLWCIQRPPSRHLEHLKQL